MWCFTQVHVRGEQIIRPLSVETLYFDASYNCCEHTQLRLEFIQAKDFDEFSIGSDRRNAWLGRFRRRTSFEMINVACDFVVGKKTISIASFIRSRRIVYTGESKLHALVCTSRLKSCNHHSHLTWDSALTRISRKRSIFVLSSFDSRSSKFFDHCVTYNGTFQQMVWFTSIATRIARVESTIISFRKQRKSNTSVVGYNRMQGISWILKELSKSDIFRIRQVLIGILPIHDCFLSKNQSRKRQPKRGDAAWHIFYLRTEYVSIMGKWMNARCGERSHLYRSMFYH